MDESQLKEELKKYYFFHIIKLTENLSTPGDADAVPIQNVALKALRSLDVKNKRVLDVGCRCQANREALLTDHTEHRTKAIAATILKYV